VSLGYYITGEGRPIEKQQDGKTRERLNEGNFSGRRRG